MTAGKIREAALQLFARSGYDGVPLSEIAAAVGIRTPSIYAHYKSKDDLFIAVFEDCLQEHTRRMKQLIGDLQDRGVEEKLRTLFQDASRSYLLGQEQVTFLKVALLFPPAPLQDKLREQFALSERLLDEALGNIFEEGMRSGLLRREPVDDLIASFYCLLDGMFLQQYYYRRDDWQQRIDAVWSIFWKGIMQANII
ncbi:TetR/AcrR family transcriptional regulator [Paenibacillus validus]|uniref:TetR/AcrR family transcriptional regulator n=1 Tax=Paenibacillus TaxID=44249 RepID=UPI0006CF432A|nr:MULTISPECIES: TetR/AcrR family transcriptional regulator [Paenibacillus]MED4599504.1 TetR/AcrR family transcriptional regulator [Paenibacillus validus]MED4607083.1 TetR/AcrR family transcriptional regulator [Paenibacillus validus]